MSKEVSEALPKIGKVTREPRVKLPKNAGKYGEEAFERIAWLAENAENEKLKFDASKWVFETAFGKAAGSAETQNAPMGAIKIELGGELKRWAK